MGELVFLSNSEEFKELAGKMRECGYEYENGEFVKKEVPVHG